MLTARRFTRNAPKWILPLVVLGACTTSETLTSPKPSLTPSFSVSPSAWSAAGPGTVTLVNDGSTGNPSMTYALSGYGVVFSPQTWSFSTTASSTGAQTLNYDYSGYHAFFQVHVFLHPFVVHNSSKTYLSGIDQGPVNCCTSPSGGFHLTGSTVFNVTAGDTYGYEFGGWNFDSDSRLLGTFTILFPVHHNPPVVTPVVSGTLGSNGWYTSDVSVSWNETADSPITSTLCATTTISADTPGQAVSCSATSDGGTTSNSVTIKRDATPPVIAFAGNAGSYTVDQMVSITCSATDATSGVATSSCPGASGAAYSLGLGSHTLSASATDNAGNAGSATASFTVTVTPASLCNLVDRWVSQHGIANSMCQQLANGAYDAFRNHVSAQSGKSVSDANAAILMALSNSL